MYENCYVIQTEILYGIESSSYELNGLLSFHSSTEWYRLSLRNL